MPPLPDQPQPITTMTTFHTFPQGTAMSRALQPGQSKRRIGKLIKAGHFFFRLGCSYQRTALLPDGDALDFERLLEALHGVCAEEMMQPEFVRGVCKTMGLFPRIFGQHTSLESERSGFGWIAQRYDGKPFPSGYVLHVIGSPSKRRYQVRRVGALAAVN